MSRAGVFAVARGIWDDPDFADEAFTEREAFLWLVGEAAWRRTRVRVGSAAIELQRGQCAFSTRFMGSRWKWSEASVRRFLARMKKCSIIDAQADARATLITICKYDRFQKVGLPSDAPDDAEATQERRSSDALATQERRKEETGKHRNIEDPSSLRSEGADGAAPAEPAEDDPERRLFASGKALLGPRAGGQIAKLLKAHHGDVAAAQVRVDRAAAAQNPAEFIAGCIRTVTTGPPSTAQPMTRAQATRAEARAALQEIQDRANPIERILDFQTAFASGRS